MKLSAYAKKIGVSYRTAYTYFQTGVIKGTQLSTGTIIIDEQNTEKTQKNRAALYARVSSSENKNNLKTQLERIKSYSIAKGYTIVKEVSEIGSGINSTRKKLTALLQDKSYDIIVIEHKDRLARFGTEYIDILLNQLGKKIEIINKVNTETEDLTQDLISIITSFSARIYGQRRSKRKTEKIIKSLQKNGIEKNKETASSEEEKGKEIK